MPARARSSFELLDGETSSWPRQIWRDPNRRNCDDVLSIFLDENPEIDAAGHRVVHGGSRLHAPVLLDDRADEALEDLADLAPLHNPPGLAAIEALRSLRPELPQVACFDTAFHADMPAKASTYAVPREWRDAGASDASASTGSATPGPAGGRAELLGRAESGSAW